MIRYILYQVSIDALLKQKKRSDVQGRPRIWARDDWGKEFFWPRPILGNGYIDKQVDCRYDHISMEWVETSGEIS